ncbi:MAG TPA: HAD-IC family P-type ATPase, partial [Flavisolibacter sp.]|nr:HAD-IC family P-type ATPase [Flavisolibacter sp.]
MDAKRLLSLHGENRLRLNESKRFVWIIRDMVKEPMFILLAIACLLYFLLSEASEGFMMMAALLFVAAISVYQEFRSANALAALQSMTEPMVTVFRDGEQKEIPTRFVVPGDSVLLEEGAKVPADAVVLTSNDLSVNEAILTGESFPVEKDAETNNRVFQGTVINSGRCIASVTATGNETSLGKLGKSIITYTETRTDLQCKIDVLVRSLALFGVVAFLLIFSVNFFRSHAFIASLLFGLTLAMSAIPEEIPVAFSSFMALGAHAMAKMGIITRQPQVIENLGAVNVICLDKTGTITENKMAVATIFEFKTGRVINQVSQSAAAGDVLYYGLLASEPAPFDAMEKAIAEAFVLSGDRRLRTPMVKEYPLQGRPPMMTHVYKSDDVFLAAAKGGVERLVNVCRLTAGQAAMVQEEAGKMAAKGHRVLAVASAVYRGESFPQMQDNFQWTFEGLLSLFDPPKPGVAAVLQDFYQAGITVKLLTGDYT